MILLAPHNSGKSTTALRLALAGNRLVTDSMIFVSPDHQELQLAGFPVGIVKLRQDMVGKFSLLRPLVVAEQVRDETKYRIDLRQLGAGLVQEEAARPDHIELCLLHRSDKAHTRIESADEAEVWRAIMENSLYLDNAETWRRNLEQLYRCVQKASWYHLFIGSDPTQLVAEVSRLWEV